VNRADVRTVSVKGYYGYQHVADRRRLTSPLRRDGETFVPIARIARFLDDENDPRLTEIVLRLQALCAAPAASERR
jgi:hypothetical protein